MTRNSWPWPPGPGRDFRASVRRIQRHNILVVGSFIIGLDVDEPGIGRRIALPGTRLWDRMRSEGRIPLDTFPQDWQYYTLTFPVARYKRLSQDQAIDEMLACDRHFYAMPRILGRLWRCVWHRRQPLINLFGSLSYGRIWNSTAKPTRTSAASARHGGPRLRSGIPVSPARLPHRFTDSQAARVWPTAHTLQSRPFPVLWSIIGAALLVAINHLFYGR